MRKILFVTGEYYHVFNRGVDKRSIFTDANDLDRFLLSMEAFNTTEPIGSLYEHSFVPPSQNTSKPLVELVCYCLNPNHFHLLLRQKHDGGVSRYMQRLAGGYTNYFNERFERSGSLFQGTFKAVHIASNEQLLHVSCYINLNNKVHNISKSGNALVRSSWGEFVNGEKGICNPSVILQQIKPSFYKKVAVETVHSIRARRGTDLLSREKEIFLE